MVPLHKNIVVVNYHNIIISQCNMYNIVASGGYYYLFNSLVDMYGGKWQFFMHCLKFWSKMDTDNTENVMAT